MRIMALGIRQHCGGLVGAALVAAALVAAFAVTVMPAAALGAAPAPTLTGPGSLSGVWTGGDSWRRSSEAPVTLASGNIPERNRTLHTSAGEQPPLQPWAEALLEKRITLSKAGRPEELTLTHCLPGVPVLMLGGPYPLQFVESPNQLTILFEEQNHYRVIHLNAQHPEDPDPTFLGHSVGRWEGDTLVVDTIGFTERTPLDRVGTPHSDQLHLIERFRRIDKDTMQMIVTLEDPKAFTRTWDAKVTYRLAPAGVGINEYICENNRDLE